MSEGTTTPNPTVELLAEVDPAKLPEVLADLTPLAYDLLRKPLAERLGVRPTDARSALATERDENVCRKEFTIGEKLALGERLEGLEREAAKQRQREHGGTAPGKHLGQVALSVNGRTRDRVAAGIGMKPRTYEKAKAVYQAAKSEPARYGKLLQRMEATRKVDRAYRDLSKLQQIERIQTEPPALPQGPFRTIVADPPWAYELRSEDLTHRGRPCYPSMSLAEIVALPVATFAHEDAMLWLWTTNTHLPAAFGVVESWGFTYKTTLTWAKDGPGLGDWLRGQTEHCLLAVRGRPS
ncbi:MAG: MT-A70 family methyltransferase [Gammaproteobacteria bacterium]